MATHTRMQTEQQTSQEQRFVAMEGHEGFRQGILYIDGVAQQPADVRRWESTNGLTNYTCVLWVDPATGARRTSCNCTGWAVKKPGKPRECIHTKDMEGRATCERQAVDDTPIRITTVEQIVELVPNCTADRRALRSLVF